VLLAAHWAERWVPGSIGLLITGASLAWLLRELVLSYASYQWPRAPGVIKASWNETRVPSHRTIHVFAKLSYTYTVDGEERLGNTFQFGHSIEAGKVRAREILAEYPAGTEVMIRYRGKYATLLPGPSTWLFVWTPLVAFVFGAILYALITGT
jgi:hypothetical protein